VVNQDGEGLRDIGIRAWRFVAIGHLRQASAGEAIDCHGLHLLPGVIDTQVHFREPGLTHKEDLQSGSLSAVMGGVTAVFEMPNTDPLTVSAEALADKVKRGHHRMHCDFAFFCRCDGRQHQRSRRAGTASRLCRHQGIHGVVDRLASGCRRRRPACGAAENPPSRFLPR
jgi:dihydroorotase-like cyclic amidohydrolase